MDVSRFWLEFNPFLKNSKQLLVETAQYREALFRLSYLAKTKGFGLLTGGPGRDKTTVVRNWAAVLNPSLYKVVYSCLSIPTVSDFYRSLVESLGTALLSQAGQLPLYTGGNQPPLPGEKKPPVIIINEANYVGNAILNDLKLLFNFEMDSRDRAVVLLCGLEQLNTTLRLSVHEPLRQRLVMNFHMEGMSKAEGCSFTQANLNGAGCSQSLLCADAKKLDLVDADAVMQAINDCELG